MGDNKYGNRLHAIIQQYKKTKSWHTTYNVDISKNILKRMCFCFSATWRNDTCRQKLYFITKQIMKILSNIFKYGFTFFVLGLVLLKVIDMIQKY